ncbi:MAG: phosphatidylserine decarboxylase family protein [Rickettsiales bacterium]|nr:phosphatidylserine decarboxylase family protein [Rickettsiales bacterium]
MLKKYIPIHSEGWGMILLFSCVTIFLGIFSGALALIGAVVTVWCIYFFRDPKRTPPQNDGFLISPADGKILPIRKMIPPPELGLSKKRYFRVSIFMNIFDVHVNRIPCDGVVSKLYYHPGKFFNASFDKASVHNERMAIKITMRSVQSIGVVQIAGLIARRICCDLKEKKHVQSGDRFGIIKFGSRVDLYFSDQFKLTIVEGQKVLAGKTIIARL